MTTRPPQRNELDPASLRTCIDELAKAAHEIDGWHKDLLRSLLCGLPCDPAEMSASAHRACRFGRWYYGAASGTLRAFASFRDIEAPHESMHRMAGELLRHARAGHGVPPDAFDRFWEHFDTLKREIETLRVELEDLLHNRDPLTGAENRVAMLGRLRELHEMLLRHGPGSCIAMFDLDHFKAINDRYGHLVGDKVLAAVVREARHAIRKYDRIYRFGGEEFVILMPNTEPAAAFACCERVRSGIAALRVLGRRGQPVALTVSVGVAALDAQASVETVLARADEALYRAKGSGRNRSVPWS